MSQHGYTESQITYVKAAIENTNMKFPPQTKYEKVLRDADLSYFGIGNSNLFLQEVADLQKECNLHPESPLHITSQQDKSWGQLTLNFMLKHNWFTESVKFYTSRINRRISKY